MRSSTSFCVAYVFGGILCLLAVLRAEIVAAEPAVCSYRFGPATQSTLRSLWHGDSTYWVGSHAVGADEFEVVIAGDVLDLSTETFPMLARTEDRPITNW